MPVYDSLDFERQAKSVIDMVSRFPASRVVGSEAETAAAQIITAELEDAGIQSDVMEFKATGYVWGNSTLILRDARGNVPLDSLPYAGTKPIHRTFSRFMIQDEDDEKIGDVIGSDGPAILITQQRLDRKLLSLMAHESVDAFIHVLKPGSLNRCKQAFLSDIESARAVGGIVVTYETALRIVQAAAQAKVGIVSETGTTEVTGKNIIVNEGALTANNGGVVICAHLDSILDTPGVGDNAVACAILVELSRKLVAEAKRSDICFVWSSAEEWDIQGMKALCARWRREKAHIRFAMNLDVLGGALSKNELKLFNSECIGGDARLQVLLTNHGCITGKKPSGDDVPLAELNVPTLCLHRFGGYMHTPEDSIDKLTTYGVRRSLMFVWETLKAIL